MTNDTPYMNEQDRGPIAESTSSAVDGHIAMKLKALYTTVEREPIPDFFLDLLERLDAAEQRQG